MQRILIVGAGPGGTMTANHLARALGERVARREVEIVQLGCSEDHVYEAGYLFMAVDRKEPEEFTRPHRAHLAPGVGYRVDPATEIDTENRRVVGRSGTAYPYDYLVIATGAEVRPDLTPGAQEAGSDFYTGEGTGRLRRQLAEFESGRILCAVEMPHKCPVAYLEIVFMLADQFTRQGRRDKIELAFTYPAEAVHMMAPVAAFAQPLLDRAGIAYELEFTVDHVDPSARRVVAKDGRESPFDLLIHIPTHRAPEVINASGLADGQGWIDTDPRTLQRVGDARVYVLGDATNLHTLGVSKAGSAAHYQAAVVAGNLARALDGRAPTAAYDGKVFCFVETGLETATCIQKDYDTPAAPPPPSKLLHWFKLSFNELYWSALRGIL